MLKDFKVFQLSKNLYWQCKLLKLPRYLQDQLLRASSSVALNISEGSGKRTPKEQARFYSIALGSLRECEAIIELEKIDNDAINDLARQIGSILFKLSNKKKL